jgi:hypothetical protein
MFVGMMGLFIWWTICMFRYAPSVLWVFCFLVGIPLIFINVGLFFGVPVLVIIIFPIQRATSLWQTPTIWDSTFYLILCMVGGLLKGFIRPSEDEENPYSSQKTSWAVTIAYFIFLFLFAIFIFLFSANADQKVPWVNAAFIVTWWVVFIPFYFMILLGLLVFLIKSIIHWRLVIKQGDPNGDSRYKGAFYSGLMVFCILMFIAAILTIIAAEYAVIPFWAAMIPCCLGYIVIIGLSLMPFLTLFQKKVSKESGKKREMLTAF